MLVVSWKVSLWQDAPDGDSVDQDEQVVDWVV
jgi:hypothetical protein